MQDRHGSGTALLQDMKSRQDTVDNKLVYGWCIVIRYKTIRDRKDKQDSSARPTLCIVAGYEQQARLTEQQNKTWCIVTGQEKRARETERQYETQ